MAIRAALAGSRQVGDRRGEAWALQHLAWISFIDGRPIEAESRLSEAADTFAELGDVGGLGWALGLLAYVCFMQGDLARAEELGAQVLVESRQRGDRWGEGMMLLLGAGVCCWSGRTAEGLEYARQSHALFASIGDRFGQAQALATLGRVLVMVGRVGEGMTILSDALDDSLADPEARDRTTLVMGLAGAAVAIGDADVALEAFDRVRDVDISGMGAGLGAGALELDVTHALALLQAGRTDEALARLESMVDGADPPTSSPYAMSSLALALATSGQGEAALSGAGGWDRAPPPTSTGLASLAIGLALARSGDDAAADELAAGVGAVDERDR